MHTSKRKTVKVPIADIALSFLDMDDAYPDIGMGMIAETAVDLALAKYNIKRKDVDYDEIVEEVRRVRSKMRR